MRGTGFDGPVSGYVRYHWISTTEKYVQCCMGQQCSKMEQIRENYNVRRYYSGWYSMWRT